MAGLFLSTQLSYVGIAYTTAANAAILQAATPVMVDPRRPRLSGRAVAPRQQAGVAISVLGVLVVITDGRLWMLRLGDLRAGDFVTLVALVGWTTYTVYGKRVLATHSPALTVTAAYVAGTVLLVAFATLTAPVFPRPIFSSVRAWVVVFYHAILGAVAHTWWYRGVELVGASRAAVFMNVTPIVGVVLAGTLLDEPIGIWEVLGTLAGPRRRRADCMEREDEPPHRVTS